MRRGANVFVNNKQTIDFSHNDYLGLSQHPCVKKALSQAALDVGFGSGSSPMVSGYSEATETLEKQFARFIGYPKAMFFNSGYHANLAVTALLSQTADMLVADKYIHASMLDGCRLAGVKLKRYRHQDLAAFKQVVSSLKAPSFCLSEGVFSMDGDVTPLGLLHHQLKGTWHQLVIDDAHGFGVLGKNGRGSVSHSGLTAKEVPICIVPLGKAMGGMGAMVCADETIIEKLIQFSRSYIYSTALPPALSLALQTSLALLESADDLRTRLLDNIHSFNRRCRQIGLKLISEDDTPIRSLFIGDNHKACQIQQKLSAGGFWVSCIRPPTVPEGTARLRVSLSALHDQKTIEALFVALVRFLNDRQVH